MDLAFPKNNEADFTKIAKKLGITLLFAYDKQEKNNTLEIGIYPIIKKANLLIAYAKENIREQIEKWPIDALIDIENVTFNQVLLSLIAKRKIILIFLLENLLYSENKIKKLEKIQLLIPLLRKYNVQFMFATGAKSPYNLRSMHDLMSFGLLMGMMDQEVKNSFNLLKERIEHNQKIKKGQIDSSGIIVEE